MEPACAEAPARQERKGVTRGMFVRMKKIFGWLHDGLYPNCTSLGKWTAIRRRTFNAERPTVY